MGAAGLSELVRKDWNTWLACPARVHSTATAGGPESTCPCTPVRALICVCVFQCMSVHFSPSSSPPQSPRPSPTAPPSPLPRPNNPTYPTAPLAHTPPPPTAPPATCACPQGAQGARERGGGGARLAGELGAGRVGAHVDADALEVPQPLL
jgi:hypothetical protein